MNPKSNHSKIGIIQKQDIFEVGFQMVKHLVFECHSKTGPFMNWSTLDHSKTGFQITTVNEQQTQQIQMVQSWSETQTKRSKMSSIQTVYLIMRLEHLKKEYRIVNVWNWGAWY